MSPGELCLLRLFVECEALRVVLEQEISLLDLLSLREGDGSDPPVGGCAHRGTTLRQNFELAGDAKLPRAERDSQWQDSPKEDEPGTSLLLAEVFPLFFADRACARCGFRGWLVQKADHGEGEKAETARAELLEEPAARPKCDVSQEKYGVGERRGAEEGHEPISAKRKKECYGLPARGAVAR